MIRDSLSRLQGRVSSAAWIGDITGSLVWLNLLRLQLFGAGPTLRLSHVLTILLTTVIVILFLTRREARQKGSLPEFLLAIGGTFVTLLLPGQGPESWLSSGLQIGGGLLGIAALFELRDSFGLAPADRGLKQAGVYAVIRHPLYASELVFFLGYFVSSPSVRSALIIAVWWAFQVVRIWREEMIIEGYSAYAKRVRWRIIPPIW